MSFSELNPWGFTSIAAAIVSISFAYFLWKTAAATPVTRRFIVLLMVEVATVLTSSSGFYLLFNHDIPQVWGTIFEVIHSVGDFLMLVLYPIFIAYALPIKFMKPLSTPKGRYTAYSIGFVLCTLFMLLHFDVIASDLPVDMWLYSAMVILFVVVFFISLVGVKAAQTKLAREKAWAFVFAFGFRDLAWATLYLSVITGWIEKAPLLLGQLYVGPTLIYIPIMVYGILKLQMLDIEIRLKSTLKNSFLAGTFVAMYYLVSESVDTLLTDQLSGIIGIVVSGLLTLFLTPLHRWADGFASKLVGKDIDSPDYSASRSEQMYSAAVDETLSFGEVTRSHIALLDRLKESLQIAEQDAERIELELNFSRASVLS
jgi:hypothetical protein